MGVLALEFETVFLREFSSVYFGEIAYTPEAERQMLDNGVSLTEVFHALQSGIVTYSEKSDACGAEWIVEGDTLGEKAVEIRLEVFCDRYHICIVGVREVKKCHD